jgi:hypothetical protein
MGLGAGTEGWKKQNILLAAEANSDYAVQSGFCTD